MLYIASDHAGFEMKEMLKKHLEDREEWFTDLGPTTFMPDDDYPEYASLLSREIQGHDGRGILLCGNAVGVCMTANKFRGIRAGIGYSEYAAKSQREDDDTNVLCLPARVLSNDDAKKILDIWLDTPFSPESRHKRRLEKVAEIEEQNMKA